MMMSLLRCALLVSAAIALVVAVDFPSQPVNYITKQNIIVGPRTTRHFFARLCGGCLYDMFNASISLNLPKHEWNDTSGNYLRVNISSASTGKQVASNIVNPYKQLPDFSFIYYKSYGDLTFLVVTGPATSFTYTVSLRFSPTKKQQLSSSMRIRDCEPRWKSSELEKAQQRQYARAVRLASLGDVEDLVPVFHLETKGVIATDSFIGYQIDYCFPDDLPYHITVSVIGTDDMSGFSSFGCPKSYGPCNVESPYFDLTGAAVNFVKVPIKTDADIGPVQFLINGDGRYRQNNTFRLGASPYVRGI